MVYNYERTAFIIYYTNLGRIYEANKSKQDNILN